MFFFQSDLHVLEIIGNLHFILQTRSPKLSQSPQPSLGEQAEHLSEASADSLEAMSEGESPSPFSRGSRTRASLPVVRSANQTKERSLGKILSLWLQHLLIFALCSLHIKTELFGG